MHRRGTSTPLSRNRELTPRGEGPDRVRPHVVARLPAYSNGAAVAFDLHGISR